MTQSDENRFFTGMFARVVRDGRIQTIDIAALTDAELDHYFTEHANLGARWAIMLARWIRDNVVVVSRMEEVYSKEFEHWLARGAKVPTDEIEP